MSIGSWTIVGVLGILAVYMLARLVSAAYFNSKHDYESRKSKPNPEDLKDG